MESSSPLQRNGSYSDRRIFAARSSVVPEGQPCFPVCSIREVRQDGLASRPTCATICQNRRCVKQPSASCMTSQPTVLEIPDRFSRASGSRLVPLVRGNGPVGRARTQHDLGSEQRSELELGARNFVERVTRRQEISES